MSHKEPRALPHVFRPYLEVLVPRHSVKCPLCGGWGKREVVECRFPRTFVVRCLECEGLFQVTKGDGP